jgi:hypothetical protein
MIILPKVNQSQPSTRSLSGSHLTEGLTALVNAAGGIEPINLARSNRTAIQGTVDFSVVESKTTWRVRQQAADGAVTAPTTSAAPNLSFLVQYHPLSLATTANGRGVTQWAATALNAGGPRLSLNQTTTGDLRVYWGGAYRFTWTGGAAVGKTQTVLVTISGNDLSLYANGALINSTSNAPTNPGVRLYFGNAFPQSFDGHVSMGAAWERTLSPVEALGLTANPWQLFESQRTRFPLDAAAVTAYTLDTTPGAYNITGSSPSLLASRLVDTTPGAYDLTGADAQTLLGRALDTTPGDYDITGSSPSLLLGRALDTTPGDYDITGSPVDLEKATAGQFVLQTTPGAYNITGFPVELIANIAVIGGGGPGKTATRGWANERARFEESLRTEEVAEQVKAAQRVLKKAQSESAQRLGELVTEYEAARASLDELREQVARIERESRIREEVEVASKVVEIFAREEEEIIAILEIIDEMDSRALLAAVGIAA